MSNIEKIRQEIERLAKRADRRTDKVHASHNAEMERYGEDYWNGYGDLAYALLSFIDSLQQEQQMPDSTQLIAEWEREKAVLEQKDFRGDAERMAYNAFLDGFVKGIGYGCTK